MIFFPSVNRLYTKEEITFKMKDADFAEFLAEHEKYQKQTLVNRVKVKGKDVSFIS